MTILALLTGRVAAYERYQRLMFEFPHNYYIQVMNQ